MLNHARTLLMNVSGDGYGGWLGDEYIPPTYVPVVLPSYLEKLRVYFFGTNPDRVFLNYRVRQLLAVLHSTPLVEFVESLDSRISYDVNNQDLFADSNYGLNDTDNLFFTNRIGAPDVLGRSFHKWKIRRMSSVTIWVEKLSPNREVTIQEYVITDGLSNILSLPGSEAGFRFRDSELAISGMVLATLTPAQLALLTPAELLVLALAAPPTTLVTDQRVEGYARPERDLGEIAANLKESGAPFALSLFGAGTPTGASEPFLTFRNLWNNHPELAYQLGGLLLAIVYRTEELTRPFDFAATSITLGSALPTEYDYDYAHWSKDFQEADYTFEQALHNMDAAEFRDLIYTTGLTNSSSLVDWRAVFSGVFDLQQESLRLNDLKPEGILTMLLENANFDPGNSPLATYMYGAMASMLHTLEEAFGVDKYTFLTAKTLENLQANETFGADSGYPARHYAYCSAANVFHEVYRATPSNPAGTLIWTENRTATGLYWSAKDFGEGHGWNPAMTGSPAGLKATLDNMPSGHHVLHTHVYLQRTPYQSITFAEAGGVISGTVKLTYFTERFAGVTDSSGNSATTLIDSDATFQADGVAAGDRYVHVESSSRPSTLIVSVDSEIKLTLEAVPSSSNHDSASYMIEYSPEESVLAIDVSQPVAESLENPGSPPYADQLRGAVQLAIESIPSAPPVAVWSDTIIKGDEDVEDYGVVNVFFFAPTRTGDIWKYDPPGVPTGHDVAGYYHPEVSYEPTLLITSPVALVGTVTPAFETLWDYPYDFLDGDGNVIVDGLGRPQLPMTYARHDQWLYDFFDKYFQELKATGAHIDHLFNDLERQLGYFPLTYTTRGNYRSGHTVYGDEELGLAHACIAWSNSTSYADTWEDRLGAEITAALQDGSASSWQTDQLSLDVKTFEKIDQQRKWLMPDTIGKKLRSEGFEKSIMAAARKHFPAVTAGGWDEHMQSHSQPLGWYFGNKLDYQSWVQYGGFNNVNPPWTHFWMKHDSSENITTSPAQEQHIRDIRREDLGDGTGLVTVRVFDRAECAEVLDPAKGDRGNDQYLNGMEVGHPVSIREFGSAEGVVGLGLLFRAPATEKFHVTAVGHTDAARNFVEGPDGDGNIVAVQYVDTFNGPIAIETFSAAGPPGVLTVTADLTNFLQAGDKIAITGATTSNGLYTIQDIAVVYPYYENATTTVTLDEAIAETVADGVFEKYELVDATDYAITAVDTVAGTFTVAEDLSFLDAGDRFVVSLSTGNDTIWTVVSTSGAGPTIITVDETIGDATPDGEIALVTVNRVFPLEHNDLGIGYQARGLYLNSVDGWAIFLSGVRTIRTMFLASNIPLAMWVSNYYWGPIREHKQFAYEWVFHGMLHRLQKLYWYNSRINSSFGDSMTDVDVLDIEKDMHEAMQEMDTVCPYESAVIPLALNYRTIDLQNDEIIVSGAAIPPNSRLFRVTLKPGAGVGPDRSDNNYTYFRCKSGATARVPGRLVAGSKFTDYGWWTLLSK